MLSFLVKSFKPFSAQESSGNSLNALSCKVLLFVIDSLFKHDLKPHMVKLLTKLLLLEIPQLNPKIVPIEVKESYLLLRYLVIASIKQ